MDFLLASYRKHRRWVWLKQLLLLLLRMLAIAAAVAMLAKLVTQDQLGRIVRRANDAPLRAVGRQPVDGRPHRKWLGI